MVDFLVRRVRPPVWLYAVFAGSYVLAPAWLGVWVIEHWLARPTQLTTTEARYLAYDLAAAMALVVTLGLKFITHRAGQIEQRDVAILTSDSRREAARKLMHTTCWPVWLVALASAMCGFAWVVAAMGLLG